jgi:hypothetical protein
MQIGVMSATLSIGGMIINACNACAVFCGVGG